MYRKKGRGWTKHADFMLLDILCMQLAFIVSYIVRFGIDNPYTDRDYRILAIAFLFIDFFVEIVSDSFKNVLKRGYFDELTATCKHVILVELVATFYLFTTQMGSIYSRFSYYIMVPLYIVITYVARLIWKKILQKKEFNTEKKALLILAPEKILRETLQTVSQNLPGYSRIVAVSLDTDITGTEIYGIPVVAGYKDVIGFACGEWIDEVFIPPCDENQYPDELVSAFMEMGITVHTGIMKSGILPSGCQQVEKIGDYTVITTSMNYADSSKLTVKRMMDIAGGLAGCLITLLILIIVGPVIYINSPGPIFFSQERIGRNGRKFRMYKFRSMYMDAESRKKELMSQNKISDGMMFKLDADYDNVTWYGMGPEETYVDRCEGAKLGIYRNKVEDNMAKYMVPQECGNKVGVRWASVTDRKGRGMLFTGDAMEFSALPYTPHEMENAMHPFELPQVHYTVVRVSKQQMGIAGDDSWGAKPLPEYLIKTDEKMEFTFTFKGI